MTTAIFSNGSALYNNGKIAISKDLVFGIMVHTNLGWQAIYNLDSKELATVNRAIDGDPLFLWKEELSMAMVKVVAEEEIAAKVDASFAADSMTSSEYLSFRKEDLVKIVNETIVSENGTMFFRNKGYTFAVAIPESGSTTSYTLECTDGRTLGKGLSKEALYAKVLRRFG